MLISNQASIGVIVGFTLTFDDETLNHTMSCKVGDKVTVTARDTVNPLQVTTFTGVITKIAVTLPLEEVDNPVLTIDASEAFSSKVYVVQAYDIMDIKAAIEVQP